jgi:putative nucleotidyltransferase with HDIG domain
MIRIDTKHLKIGMFVSGLDRPWEETPFVFQGFPIKSEKQILKLQELCQTVQIDQVRSDKSIDFEPFIRKKKPKPSAITSFINLFRKKQPTRTAVYQQEVEKPFEDELVVAKQVYVNTTASLQQIMEDFRLSKEVSAAEIKSCVHSVIDGVMNNPNALALLSNLKSKQQDSVRHNLNVCILCLLFGRYLGLSKEQLNELGYAALLHDVGEIKIPQEILNKHYRQLTADEKKIMEQHTTYGAEILRQQLGIPESAAQVAHSHHERMNGRGYPRGLKGDEIDFFSKIVAIVDVYESVTNNPNVKIKISCSDALKSIYSMCDTYFDRELVEDFIKCLGIYPIGSVVELNTKEIAIVVSVKPGKHLLPTVMIVIASEGIAYYPPKMVNLDNFKNKDGSPQLFIINVITPESVGIDLSDYVIREAGFGR